MKTLPPENKLSLAIMPKIVKNKNMKEVKKLLSTVKSFFIGNFQETFPLNDRLIKLNISTGEFEVSHIKIPTLPLRVVIYTSSA